MNVRLRASLPHRIFPCRDPIVIVNTASGIVTLRLRVRRRLIKDFDDRHAQPLIEVRRGSALGARVALPLLSVVRRIVPVH